MTVYFTARFYREYKKANVRVRHRVDKRLGLFKKNPNDPELNNHPLKRNWSGYRSITITADWRAIYEEVEEAGEIVAYFAALGTHSQLYRRN